MALAALFGRARRFLLAPKTEWPLLAAAPDTVAGLYRNHLFVVAAIPALAYLLSAGVIGISMPILGSYRISLVQGLLGAVFTYVIALASLALFAIVIDRLAPRFGGSSNRVQALKSVAFPYTALAVAAVPGLLPGLGLLALLAGLGYFAYLLKLGLPYTMGCPSRQSGRFTAVVMLAYLLVAVPAGPLLGLALSRVGVWTSGPWNNAGEFDQATLGAKLERLAQGSARSDREADPSAASGGDLETKVERWSEHVAAASKRLEAASKSGDGSSQSAAVGQVLGALLGADGKVEAVAPERLRQFLPELLGKYQRSELEAERKAAMGVQIATASANYADGTQHFKVVIADTGILKGLMGFAQTWAGFEQERQTEHGYEKTYKKDGRLTHARWDSRERQGEYSVVVAERFTVTVSGAADTPADLERVAQQIDLSGLEALQQFGVAAQKD